MDDTNDNAQQLKGARAASVEYDAGSSSSSLGEEHNAADDNAGNDAEGNTVSSSSSTGDASESSGQSEHSEGVANETESSSTSTVETVSPADFEDFAAIVEIRLDALVASSVVLVVTLWVCIGVLAVNEIVASLRTR